MSLKQNTTSYGRFKGASWFSKLADSMILIGGAGSIGSNVAFQLARTGADIAIVDNDTVGIENLAGQMYGPAQVGKTKVRAIAEVIASLCEKPTITPINELVIPGEGQWLTIIPMADVVIVGFDNLPARRVMYEEWRKNGKDTSLFIDGRLSMENGEIYVLEKIDLPEVFDGYEKTYFRAEEREELPCTMKSTTHCGMILAGLIVANITNWFNNQDERFLPRDTCNFKFYLELMKIDKPRLVPPRPTVVTTEEPIKAEVEDENEPAVLGGSESV